MVHLDELVAYNILSFVQYPHDRKYTTLSSSFRDAATVATEEQIMWNKYPFWNNKDIQLQVIKLYMWMACYHQEPEMIEILLKAKPEMLPIALEILHVFNLQDLMNKINNDAACQEYLETYQRHNMKKGFLPITQKTWIEYIRSRSSLSLRQDYELKEIVQYKTIIPTFRMLELVDQVDMNHCSTYIYALPHLWNKDIQNIDTTDVTIQPDKRVAKLLALGLPVPESILIYEKSQKK